MDDWWTEIDGAILEALATYGAMSPADVAGRAGISEGEATAFLAMLVREGKVKICVVELVGAPHPQAPHPALSPEGRG